ncbi:MAG: DUF488 domain-containing protein [Minisyncoccia bacterium]
MEEKERQDGHRISVMSRHTLNDGVTPDTRITNGSFDEHCPELAPTSKLIGDYYKRGLSWSQFELRFREQIKNPSTQEILRAIATKSLSENVTLLCIEAKPHFCHRRLLAEECQTLVPEIIINLR